MNRFVPALLVLLLGFTTPFLLEAQSAAELQEQISSHQAQIDALNREIAAFEKELTSIGAKKQTLQSALDTINVSLKRTTAKVKAAQTQIASLELEIRQLNGHIGDKEAAIAIDSAAIAEMVRELNSTDQASFLEMILAEESVTDVWEKADNLQTIQGTMQQHVLSLEEVKDELTEDRDATAEKKGRVEEQRQILRSEEESLAVQKREQQSLLTETRSQESNYQKLVGQKRASREQFENTLNELESRLEYTLDASKIPAAGKGVLRWPVDSVKVTQYFGNTAFAQSGAYSGKGHNGVDFKASIGTPVKAALRGTVLGTGNTDATRGCYSYGKWILLQHQNGLSTLYGHLSQISVSQGQSVVTGQVIGYSGNTGYSTGPHLHFTLYASNAVRIQSLGSASGKSTPCASAVLPVSPQSGYLNPMDYL
ncbi:MAG: peptidoglycan DD-metalloendopeptidase family protein [Methylomonas sp.]|nr:peptidoglycan DD-metalloendopeptidase family protein [Methylomonas sp.]